MQQKNSQKVKNKKFKNSLDTKGKNATIIILTACFALGKDNESEDVSFFISINNGSISPLGANSQSKRHRNKQAFAERDNSVVCDIYFNYML